MANDTNDPAYHNEKRKHLSFTERDEFWKDTPKPERMGKWRNNMNAILDGYKHDPTAKAQHTFLKRILIRDDQTTLDEVEVTADAVYSTFIEGQAAGDVEYYVRRIIEKTGCNIDEIKENSNLIERLANIYGANSAKIATQLIQDTFNDYTKLYSIIGADLKEGVDIAISQKARQQGLYIIGANGTGKSTLLANLILTDIKQRLGVCLIEPHGDLTRTIIAGIPESRLKDVILLDMADSQYPFGLNLFQCDAPNNLTQVSKTASFVMHVFEKVWGVGTHTPLLAQVLRNVTRTLIENPGTTFAEIPLLLWEETAREKLLTNLKNAQSQMFWAQYGRKTQRDKDEYISSTINKVDAYLNEPMIANIVSQEKTTINFRTIMDEGKILLVHLSPQLEEMSRLIGAILIGKLLMAAFSRTDTPEANRRQFNLYCDEYQRFATSEFATLISEARKFRIATTLSHQTLSQVDEANRTAALGAGNLIAFRVSGEDGKSLSKSFDTTPTKELTGQEPVRAPVSDVISQLLKRGHNDVRVTRFAQVYLQNFEDLLNKLGQYAEWPVYGDYLIELRVQEPYVRQGRNLASSGKSVGELWLG